MENIKLKPKFIYMLLALTMILALTACTFRQEKATENINETQKESIKATQTAEEGEAAKLATKLAPPPTALPIPNTLPPPTPTQTLPPKAQTRVKILTTRTKNRDKRSR